MDELPVTPFRWDLRRRQTLGGLLDGEVAACYEGFTEDLCVCAARAVAFGGDSDLFFVGRSPESLFDYLSGILLDTSWSDRLHLVHFSLRSEDPDQLLAREPAAVRSLRAYFGKLGLDPEAIIGRDRPLAFVDLVSSGGTLGNLTKLLQTWSKERRLDWLAVHRKLRYVGITWAKKTSPNTWRWQQHCDWVGSIPAAAINNVSVPGWLWDYLGNRQAKTSWSHHWRYWGAPEIANPPRGRHQLEALRLAFHLFEQGRTRAERQRFVAELNRQREVAEGWFRSLASEIRASGGE